MTLRRFLRANALLLAMAAAWAAFVVFCLVRAATP